MRLSSLGLAASAIAVTLLGPAKVNSQEREVMENDRVIPALQADVKVFGRWAEKGLCRPIDARHLMVVLWSATQAYADFARQICLVLGKARLTRKDLAVAEAQLVDMVLRAVLVAPPADVDARPARATAAVRRRR